MEDLGSFEEDPLRIFLKMKGSLCFHGRIFEGDPSGGDRLMNLMARKQSWWQWLLVVMRNERTLNLKYYSLLIV